MSSEDKNTNSNEQEDVVTPWTVSSQSETGIDYDKLISKNKKIFSFI